MKITPFFENRHPGPARIAILMSGAGTNAEALLEFERATPDCGFATAVIFTDAPTASRAGKIAGRFDVPLAALDIRAFYREHGEEAISLVSARRRELREEWTCHLRNLLKPFEIDFVVLAGFVPLCNITNDYACLNVHPGDLRVTNEDGLRRYAGLHFRPVERAILDGKCELHSSVILAQPFRGSGKAEMDSGPVLGVSAGIPVELGGFSLDELQKIDAARTPGVKADDALRKIAAANLERLKTAGDHKILPPVTADFARGRLGSDDTGRVWRLAETGWLEV
ncbi:MAG: hypothetical protein PHI35_07310 [Victivallaceae bacterium]|nr:hypothetical protein [Victivallaceae bacterium]